MTTRTGQCDCCGADSVELSFSVSYGIETWSCAEGCDADPDKLHAERVNALINDPEAKAIVENWLSGFGDPPLGISQLQKDWLVSGIAATIQKATKERDYAVRWANRSVDSVKTECFAAVDDARDTMNRAHSALDAALGDTDVDHYETDDEMREEEPVQWAAMQLAVWLNKHGWAA